MSPTIESTALLSLVAGLREQIKRSPGLSAGPFSDEGLALIEAHAKDAERYRFLRQRGKDKYLEDCWWDDHGIIRLDYDGYTQLTEEALDAAIDAALIDGAKDV